MMKGEILVMMSAAAKQEYAYSMAVFNRAYEERKRMREQSVPPTVIVEPKKEKKAKIKKEDKKKDKKKDSVKKSTKKAVTPKTIEANDWSKKHKKAKKEKPQPTRKDIETQLMMLIIERDRLKHKLCGLNPYTKKDAEKMMKLNVKLQDIEYVIKDIQQTTGVTMSGVTYYGNAFERFLDSIKRKFQAAKKKLKKFYKTYKEEVIGIVCAAVPLLIAGIVKLTTTLLTV